MKITITKCDWCKKETAASFTLPFGGYEYDICPDCREEIELKLAGPVPPAAAPAPAPKATKAKATKAKEEPVAVTDGWAMADHSAALCKGAGLDMRLGDQAALHEGILRDHAGISYPSWEAMAMVYEEARVSRPILFQGDLPHHKEALKSVLETFGVDFSTLDGRKTASEMKATLELEGVTLTALPEFVEKHINVGF